MTQQTKDKLREEFNKKFPSQNLKTVGGYQFFPNPDQRDVCNWWLSKLDEAVAEEIKEVLPEKRTYKARGINNQYFEDGFNHCYWLILKRLKERGLCP